MIGFGAIWGPGRIGPDARALRSSAASTAGPAFTRGGVALLSSGAGVETAATGLDAAGAAFAAVGEGKRINVMKGVVIRMKHHALNCAHPQHPTSDSVDGICVAHFSKT